MGVFKHKNIQIELLRHDSIRILFDTKKIYIDPYGIQESNQDADIVLISHSHYDHLSIEDIGKIAVKKTPIICSLDAVASLKKAGYTSVFGMKPNEFNTIQGIDIKTIPAYNLGKEFHPKKNQWLGFIIQLGDYKVYFAGDTDITEEAKQVKCDIALLPVSGTYVMTSSEAADLAAAIRPPIAAIPMHFGAIIGGMEDAERFVKLCIEKGVSSALALEPKIKG